MRSQTLLFNKVLLKSGHHNRLEREGMGWEITTMQAVKIDKQKRVRLKIFTPGTDKNLLFALKYTKLPPCGYSRG